MTTTRYPLMNRRRFLAAGAATIPALLTGCATPALYSQINEPEYRQYKETVNQVLISQDGKTIVILGAEHHYIMNAPENLVASIQSGFHAKLQASFRTFTVNLEGNIHGELTMQLDASATGHEREQAKAMKFDAYGVRDSSVALQRTFVLRGKRYAAGKFALPPQATPLNQSYTIAVDEQQPVGGKAALAVLTPITVAADGALVLLAIPLIPVAAIYLYHHPLRFM